MSLEENASRLAESLRLKNFPVFVSKQPGDHLYKVVVGPYPDTQAARSAKDDLEKDGIKPIVKRWTP